MLGGANNKDRTKSVPDLLTDRTTTIIIIIWHRVADAPAYYSTCAGVNGELLAVGGRDKDAKTFKPSSTIHKYNPTTNSWDLISNMPTYC